MKKLKNKVFFTIFTLLSLFLITILTIYNYQNYNEVYKSVKNNLRRFNENELTRRFNDFENRQKKDNQTPPEKPNGESVKPQMMVMDSIIYTVKLDDDKNITSITSYSLNEEDTERINEIAYKIIKSNSSEKIYIGNLYTNRYSYNYKNNFMAIIDNSKVNDTLNDKLKISIGILFLTEIIIFVISKNITNWIIKPVVTSFNKQKQFIADASHELKTPLAVIMASGEALSDDPNEKKWIHNIQNESERMSKLITNLLDLAKLENDNIKRVYEKNNLSKIIEKSVLTFESIMFEKNINLKYDIEEDIYFKFNIDEIKEVMSILLDNATKHCSKNGEINVNLKNTKDYIILDVINTGEPIPKGEEEKIFERFYRVDKARNRNENRYGLGLAIAKQIVENHGGTIKAKSQDKKTTFTIKLKK